MSDDLFNFNNQFEEALSQKLNPYEHDLKKAKIYCVRGQYDNALAIYDRILEEDIENQEAYLGLLRAHSENYTIYFSETIDRDVYTLDSLFPDLNDHEYVKFKNARGQLMQDNSMDGNIQKMNKPDEILALGDQFFNKEAYNDAYKCYERAAKLGFSEAFMRIGYLHYYGYGVNKDQNLAIRFYQKAIEKGAYRACYLLGLAYLNDLENDKEAFKYFSIGAEKGERSCIACLGYMQMYGKGTEVDYAAAFQNLSIGLEAEQSFTCTCLGYLYENGLGTEKNLESALTLYKRAAALGDTYAKSRVKALVSKGIMSGIVSALANNKYY